MQLYRLLPAYSQTLTVTHFSSGKMSADMEEHLPSLDWS